MELLQKFKTLCKEKHKELDILNKSFSHVKRLINGTLHYSAETNKNREISNMREAENLFHILIRRAMYKSLEGAFL